MSYLHRFFRANQDLVKNLVKYLPQGDHTLPFKEYKDVVVSYMCSLEQPVILDIGGGAKCPFSPYKPPGGRIIVLDISPEQLAKNRDADELILADATREIPLPDASVDLVISQAVMEHLKFPKTFLYNSYRVLKPGGYGIHIFPSKFALFALINGLLPAALSRRVLFFFQTDWSQEAYGFPAYYRDCYYTGIKRLLHESGFKIKEIRCFHFQSHYFNFFLPLFMLSALYEIITFPIKNLASYLLVIAQKS